MTNIDNLMNEAIKNGADIWGGPAIGLALFPTPEFDLGRCEALMAKLELIAKKENKKLNIRLVKGDKC